MASKTNCLSTSGFYSVCCSDECEPLMQQIESDIAHMHGGQVPLHGRLFAQWMHHAFPRECPFPHASGTTNPMSPDDWMAQHGLDNVEATLEEMQMHHARLEEDLASEDADAPLPWTSVEELVSGEQHQVQRSVFTPLRCIMALAALTSFALPLLRASAVAVHLGPPKAAACLV